MYIDKAWYRVAASKAVIEGRPDNTVAALDVSLLQDVVLSPLLAIDDPRTSKRINFVGGIRGLSYLSESVDRLGGVAFFALSYLYGRITGRRRFWRCHAAEVNMVRA